MNRTLALAAIASAFASVPAAAVVVVTDTTIHDSAFTVAAGDLLQAAGTTVIGTGSFSREGEIGLSALTDGGFGAVGSINSGNGNLAAATADNTNTVTFSFAKAVNLKSIATYAGWDAFRGGQSYTVSYATAAAATTFTALASEYNNAFGGGNVATRTVITATSPYLANHVVALKFAFNNDLEAGYAGYREIDAIGGAVPEPGVWAMLLAGFGLIGIATRRRALRTA